jgi:hypothetical protein
MKPKTLILILAAACCGVIGRYVTTLVTAQLAAQTEVEKISVLVARRDIGRGTLLTEPDKWFQERQFVKGEEPTSAIRRFDELKDRRLNKPLSAEQFVTAEDLLFEPQKNERSDEQEPGVRKDVVNPTRARAASETLIDAVKDSQRKPERLEPDSKQKLFYANLVKSFERSVSDLKQSTRKSKDRAERHRSMLRRYEAAEQTLTQYNALLQAQRDQQQMDDRVRRMEARDKRLEKLMEQLRQAVSVQDWELAARVHSRLLKECAEAGKPIS